MNWLRQIPLGYRVYYACACFSVATSNAALYLENAHPFHVLPSWLYAAFAFLGLVTGLRTFRGR